MSFNMTVKELMYKLSECPGGLDVTAFISQQGIYIGNKGLSANIVDIEKDSDGIRLITGFDKCGDCEEFKPWAGDNGLTGSCKKRKVAVAASDGCYKFRGEGWR